MSSQRKTIPADFMETPLIQRVLPTSKRLALPVFQEGQRFLDFQIRRLLGQGAFASVYLAEQISLGREVALKVSLEKGDEARLLATLEHEHIVRVFSEGTDNRRKLHWICMQFVPGRTLEELWLERRNSGDQTPYEQEILFFMMRLAQALHYAHERNVLHLDVKPGNILIDPSGRPLITDFNVSLKRNRDNSVPTSIGGTFEYMSPEQRELFQAEDRVKALTQIGPRADIFSLGKVFEEWCPNQDPLTPLGMILRKCLEPEIKDRFLSARDLANACEGALELKTFANAMPEESRLHQVLSQFPLLTLTLVGAIPQLIACMVAVTYNSIRIVTQLSPEQQVWFRWLNQTYNPIVFGVVGVLWGVLVWQLNAFLKNPYASFQRHGVVRRLRRLSQDLPLWGVLMTTLGWVPSAVVFPFTLHYQAGPLPTAAFAHFAISFTLAWLIALAYSYLLHQTVAVRSLYLRFWSGENEVAETASREFRGTSLQIRSCALLAISAPLIGAIVVLWTGLRFPSSMLRELTLLAMGLILLGMVGSAFALHSSQKLTQAILSITKGKSS